MIRFLPTLLASLIGCGSSDRTVPLSIAGCDDGALRLVVLVGADRCGELDPRGPGPTSAPRLAQWDDPNAAPPRLTFDAGSIVTVAVECRGERGTVERWGCDDDADGLLRVRVAELCVAEACDDCSADCPALTLARRLGDDTLCVPACDRCADLLCPPDQVCADGSCVPTGSCEPACQPDEVCRGGTCVPLGRDGDGDGVPVESDCDDEDPDVGPGSRVECVTACGSGQSTCGDDGSWSPCEVTSPAGECSPGDERTVACGQCGERSDSCSDSCAWLEGVCGSEGECVPDTVEPCPDSCGTRTCGGDCTWGACEATCTCTYDDNGGHIEACVGETACLPIAGCGGPGELMECQPVGIRCAFSRVGCDC